MSGIRGILRPVGQITGNLTGIGNIRAQLTPKGNIRGHLSTVKQLTGILTGAGNIRGQLTLPKGKASPAFPGAYEYTPSNVMQMIEIEGYKATQNIVIHPIPQNYGLITWNGLGIKIS